MNIFDKAAMRTVRKSRYKPIMDNRNIDNFNNWWNDNYDRVLQHYNNLPDDPVYPKSWGKECAEFIRTQYDLEVTRQYNSDIEYKFRDELDIARAERIEASYNLTHDRDSGIAKYGET